jgi:hypothetical protein
MYFHTTYHETKYCQTHLIKIQDKRNHTNQNDAMGQGGKQKGGREKY